MSKKLAHIDALRGVAILLVMLVHTAQSIPDLPRWFAKMTKYGQLGVQLFFVLSAITLSISARQHADDPNRLKNYFLRRFFRIAPLYYVGILWYWAFYSAPLSLRAGTWVNAPSYTPLNLLANFLFVHGFYPPAHNYIVPGGWSIGTEMAFYACFPLLFLLFQKMSRLEMPRFALTFFSLAVSYYLLEYGYTVWAGAPVQKNNFMYYNLLNQLPVFALGIFAYFLITEHRFADLPLWAHVFAFLFWLWLSYLLWTIDLPFANSFMFLPFTIGAAFVFLYNIFSALPILSFGILQAIGRVSYSMYIFHFIFAWNLIEYAHSRFDILGRPLILFAIYYPAVVLLAYLVALVSERFIEKPFIALGKRLTKKIPLTFGE